MAHNTDILSAGQKIIIITGPTAVGKTECAIDLALSFNGEIVNCDSRQIYKYMNIGTAKPTQEQLNTIKHYMIDVVEPSVNFSAAKYVTMADRCIDEITNAGKLPFLVGGTGFYIKALLHGLAPLPAIDEEIRIKIREKQKLYGNEVLYETLKLLDPKDAQHIKQSDTYRLIRALEVFTATGKPLIDYLEKHRFSQTRYRYIYIVLYNSDRQDYHKTINNRVDRMIADGLVDEVKGLIKMGYHAELPAMKTVGYKEIIDYLNNKEVLSTAVELIKKHTKAYAKRQITWFKGIKDALWIDLHDRKQRLIEVIKGFIHA
ncbi:MAG: tRNA (adenosine(37)-N6)-dimethylallyltransferase MiaA [bacterium]